MFLGIDVSTQLEENAANAKYFDGDKIIDPLKEFRTNNVSIMRLRIWNDPYGENGKPYLGGTNDVSNLLKLVEMGKKYGYKFLLDFHYSDFWADPSKQYLPKAWRNLSFDEIVSEVYKFTKETLLKVKELDVEVPYIQIGNEITYGMLWPHAQLYREGVNVEKQYDNLATALKAGIKAARELYPDVKIVIHLESSNNWPIYDDFFSHMRDKGVNYDVIGMSYYPYWHGSFDELFYNINHCREKFKKNVMICEVGYGFTLEDYILTDNGHNEMKVNAETIFTKLPYETSIEGQELFIEDFVERAVNQDIEGIVYWEPLWLPGDTICWSSREGQEYIKEVGKPFRNEWSNQCLFDYAGHKLPAFDKFKLL